MADPATLNVLQTADPELFAAVYAELRRLAECFLQSERVGHTLQPTALAHEAYLKLAASRGLDVADPIRFGIAAAGAIRQVLIDYARMRNRQKRPSSVGRRAISDIMLIFDDMPVGILDLDAVLERLASIAPRKAQVVELRFFAGLMPEQVATALGISKRLAQKECRSALAWLRCALADSDAKNG